jgi:hypothetical protein
MPSRLSNFIIRSVLTSALHPILGERFALITVAGARTGRRYSTPINLIPHGDGFDVVSFRDRTWWRNLRQGAIASLHLAGRDVAVRGTVIEDAPGVVDTLAAYFARFPAEARYFGIRLGAEQQPMAEDISRAAEGRVVIKLTPLSGED